MLRDHRLPPVARATHTQTLVGGQQASAIDFTHVLSSKLPLFIAIVVVLSALLLLAVFRSIAIPLQAAVMNLLSVGASLGVIVAVFQWGWLSGLFGVERAPIEPYIPVVMFAIVFGLSMDYEVFLPATLQLLGRRAWSLPVVLDRRLPRIAVHGPASALRPHPLTIREEQHGTL